MPATTETITLDNLDLTERDSYSRLSCKISYPRAIKEHFELPNQLWID